jgi:hypothetical protein
MKSKSLFLATALTLTASLALAQSETIRPLFVKENKMPELWTFEVDLLGTYTRYDESKYQSISGLKLKRNEYTVVPQVRFGAYENLTLYANVPYRFIRSDTAGNVNGFDDITLGFELLAYEYTFKYPWVIPYVEVTFPTGDDKDMAPIKKTDTIFSYSLGKVDGIFGLAIGTTVDDVFHWIIDGRYDINVGDSGIFSGAACFIWDLSDQFSFLAEAKISQGPENNPYSGIPAYFNGGLSYAPHEFIRFTAYGGTAVNCAEEGHGGLKVAYMF